MLGGEGRIVKRTRTTAGSVWTRPPVPRNNASLPQKREFRKWGRTLAGTLPREEVGYRGVETGARRRPHSLSHLSVAELDIAPARLQDIDGDGSGVGIHHPVLGDAGVLVRPQLDSPVAAPGARRKNFQDEVRDPSEALILPVRSVPGPEEDEVGLHGAGDTRGKQDVERRGQDDAELPLRDEVGEEPPKF